MAEAVELEQQHIIRLARVFLLDEIRVAAEGVVWLMFIQQRLKLLHGLWLQPLFA